MTPHLKIYTKAFKLDLCDDWQCEACNKMGLLNKGLELHHIQARGMGGTKKPDRVENLMSLCVDCHKSKGDLKQWKSWLFKVHLKTMEEHGVKFYREWIEEQIRKND